MPVSVGPSSRKRTDADVIHLIEEVLKVMGTAEEIGERTGGEEGVILNVGDELQCAAREQVENRDSLFPPRLLTRNLKRRV